MKMKTDSELAGVKTITDPRYTLGKKKIYDA